MFYKETHNLYYTNSINVYYRFILGEQLIFGGLINSFIHTIMYSYYFMSALGPHMQKYLWWKKYLTRMQIVS